MEITMSLRRCWEPAVSAGGRPLPRSVRRDMEKQFQSGLSDIRIHSGLAAATLAKQLGARAVTAGRHILFAAGEYQPNTAAGKWLLAHELAHVVQQRGQTADWPSGVGRADEPCEREADEAADCICAGRRVPALTPDRSGLARRVVQPDTSTATIAKVRGPG